MQQDRQRLIRELFDEYIEMYAARDDRLTARFSQNFSGYPGSGTRLIHNRDEWIRITSQDFAQVPGRIRMEMLDLALQDLSTDVVVASAKAYINAINRIFATREAREAETVPYSRWKCNRGMETPYIQDG